MPGKSWFERITAAGCAAAVLWAACSATAAASEIAPEKPEKQRTGHSEAERLFALKVLPLLKRKCHGCHGGDGQDVKGELDLTSREGLLQGGESGEPSVVPGKPTKSPLYRAVRWEGYEMPPKENDRLSDAEIDLLREWIAGGAPWPGEAERRRIRRADWTDQANGDGVLVATSGGLSEEWTYRRYDPADLWAYRPIGDPDVPEPAAGGKAPHPLDAFLGRRLRESGLSPAGRAEKRTLIRRATFDLTGLPPTPEEVEAFVQDESPEAWPRLIDRLLASPHYGERMAQRWLDVTRYADTAGYANDWERPHAWRYRDYVIRSFNADKPFDRFIVEQIAGDELDPDDPEMRIAVGFLRMGPWEHTAMSVAAVTRQLWLDDVTNSIGATFLGHSLRCARCHDHKFDPIPTRDYYRIQAAFASTQFAEPKVPFLDEENIAGADERLAVWKRRMGEDGLTALTRLKGDNAFGRIKKKLAAYRRRALDRYSPKALSVHTAKPEPVSILIGGSLERPGERVRPGALSALPIENAALSRELGSDDQRVGEPPSEGDSPGRLGNPPDDPTAHRIPTSAAGRRLALARWIVDGRNPLTARVIVNRLWQWHFGRGLVASANNFGKTGGRPSHPELLDFLARRLVEEGWSLKRLHRLIMTSEAYRRASEHPRPARLAEKDPNGELLARFRPRRLSAEEIRDAMLQATGELSPTAGGPGVFPQINWEVALQPRHIMGGIAPPYRPSPTPELRNRRTIFAFRYRGLADPMLEVLNRPGPDLSCARREETTVPTQAFTLLNGQFVHDRALALAHGLMQSAATSDERIQAAFRRLYARRPTEAEQRTCLAHLERMRRHHREHSPKKTVLPEVVEREMIAEQTGVPFRWQEELFLDDYQRDLKPWQVGPETRALAEVCLVLLNSSEFLYVY